MRVHFVPAFVSCVVALQCAAAWAAISVSPGGQASTSVAITVPPGIAGMAPNLAFSYSDGGINGPVGVGWSVQGISAISRCPATRPTDGVSRMVFFDALDKLCLDGQRLIQVDEGGTPLAAQSNDAGGLTTGYREFRTEKDSYARIRAYGVIEGDVARGPTHFKVWTKSGQIYHYGQFGTDVQALIMADPTGNGTPLVGAVWAVHRISDTLGNYIDFKYQQNQTAWGSGPTAEGRTGREWNIKEIHYTGTPQQAPTNRVVFDYTLRSAVAAPGHDRAEAYQRANKNVNLQLLQRVTSYVNTAGTPVPVRIHKLTYERSPSTGRSRLLSIAECTGTNDARCLPPTQFTYANKGTAEFSLSPTFGNSAMGTLKMLDASEGKYGAITGDFNGDGRTDILRWSQSAAQNELHLSLGNGTFEKRNNFNITSDQLFKNDGCYYAVAADFNGDGLSDLLRVSKPNCSPNTNLIFLSAGDGTFNKVTLPSSINLEQKRVTDSNTTIPCTIPQSVPAPRNRLRGLLTQTDPPAPTDERSLLRQLSEAQSVTPQGFCYKYRRTLGRNYHLVDANGDGFLDIVTAVSPTAEWLSSDRFKPTEEDLCLGEQGHVGGCTKVYLGRGDGTFNDPSTAMDSANLYFDPPDPDNKSNPYWRQPNQADVDGDGLIDLFTKFTGTWRSLGNGTFGRGSVQDGSSLCAMPIDFNGDQRADCLRPDSVPGSQTLTVHYGATSSGPIAQFNVKQAGDHLYARDSSDRQTVGVVVEDFNGDGRGDILRWGQAATDNGLYFSLGDGSFQYPRAASGLGSLPRPLQGIDRKTSFMLGDFLGNGSLQILHLKHGPTMGSNPESSANQLYVLNNSSLPADLLASVTSPSGLVSSVGPRYSLTQSGGVYTNDRGTPQAGQGALVDLQLPMYVIASVTQETGGLDGGSMTTEYRYIGLKAERGGRGMLGFREVRQQSPAPDGVNVTTVATEYLQQHPYIGVARRSRTYLGGLDLSGPMLSRTSYAYCDKTSSMNPVAMPDPPVPPEPCGVTSNVTRPYLYQSVEEGWDLAGQALPKVTTTTTYTPALDPQTITVVTSGNALGLAQTFTKTTTNTYFPDQTAGDQWILGRLQRSTVRNQVPNSLPSIATAAGSSPQATAQSGSGAPPTPAALPPEVMSVILQILLDD